MGRRYHWRSDRDSGGVCSIIWGEPPPIPLGARACRTMNDKLFPLREDARLECVWCSDVVGAAAALQR